MNASAAGIGAAGNPEPAALPDFSQSAEVVAPRLLGCLLWRGDTCIRVTEVEAYLGSADPASHAFRGSKGRAAIMFGPPGRMYIYTSYGMHLVGNIVCSPEGEASAVLLRAGEIVAGHDAAGQRRGGGDSLPAVKLARGPGNVGRALGFQTADNGEPVDGPLFRIESGPPPSTALLIGPRVGVSMAAERPLRFWLAGEASVSAYRRSPRAPR